MRSQRGFLLIELVSALFLLALCITLVIHQCCYIEKISHDSLQKYNILLLAQNALEKCRTSFVANSDSILEHPYSLECAISKDDVLDNFLHIQITMYHEGENVGTWFSGVALPYEA